MTTAEALDLYSKSETSRYELARMVLAGHRLRREVLTLQAEVARLTARWEALKAWAEERYMDKEYRGLFQDKMRSLESGEKEQP